MTGPYAVETHGLIRYYGRRVALAGVDLGVQPGEVFALLGPNGGGKSTLFRILTTLLAPSSGEARVMGFDVVRDPQAVRRQIGALFQSPSLDRKLTVEENLRHHGHLYGLRGQALSRRIAEVLDEVQLSDRRRDRVEKLSGGLMRRVEIAKCLVPAPSLLLLDEPGTGLDPAARRSVRELLESLRQARGVTSVLTTHLMEEADACDRVAILDRGKLVAAGAPSDLKNAIRGSVITITADRADELKDAICNRLQVEAQVTGSSLRIEHDRAYELAARIAEAFPGRIDAVSVSRPSLDDVFFKHTGHRLTEGETSRPEEEGKGDKETPGEAEKAQAPPSACRPVSASAGFAESPAPPGRAFTLASGSLAWREIVRFMRQPSRVLGGLATPVLFWLLIGSGLGRSFKAPTSAGPAGYLAYAFTGAVVMIVLFTSIFSTISIIQDRAEGFLQSVLASPASRLSIVVGKIAGATALAMLQAAAFVALAPVIGVAFTPVKIALILAVLLLVSLGLSGLGFLVAWSMESTQGFHSIMNLVLMPMWILSGALFPASGAPAWLRAVMAVNPLTYGVALLRHALEGGGVRTDEAIPSTALSLSVTVAFVVAMISISTVLAARPARQ